MNCRSVEFTRRNGKSKRTCLHASRGAEGSRDVLRENGGGETVHRVVRFGYYIILILELEDDNDRTEDLLLCDLSVGRNTGGRKRR